MNRARLKGVLRLLNMPHQLRVRMFPDAILQRVTGVLAQVVDEEVGVSLQRTSPTIGGVVVRGLTEVVVYVDGVRTNAVCGHQLTDTAFTQDSGTVHQLRYSPQYPDPAS